jgi:hypothetical protein
MNIGKFRGYLVVCSLVVISHSLQTVAQQSSDAAKTNLQQTSAERDGQHDFDPLMARGNIT